MHCRRRRAPNVSDVNTGVAILYPEFRMYPGPAYHYTGARGLQGITVR